MLHNNRGTAHVARLALAPTAKFKFVIRILIILSRRGHFHYIVQSVAVGIRIGGIDRPELIEAAPDRTAFCAWAVGGNSRASGICGTAVRAGEFLGQQSELGGHSRLRLGILRVRVRAHIEFPAVRHTIAVGIGAVKLATGHRDISIRPVIERRRRIRRTGLEDGGQGRSAIFEIIEVTPVRANCIKPPQAGYVTVFEKQELVLGRELGRVGVVVDISVGFQPARTRVESVVIVDMIVVERYGLALE